MSDNGMEEDYLDKLLKSMDEKEKTDSQPDIKDEEENQEVKAGEAWQQEIKDSDPEEIARMVRQKVEAEKEAEEDDSERELKADEVLNEMLENTPIEEAAEATLTSEDNSELSEDDMARLMNMKLDDIIDDVKSDSVSIDELFGQGSNSEVNMAEYAATDKSVTDVSGEAQADASGKAPTDSLTDTVTASADKEQKKSKKDKNNKKQGFFGKLKKVFFESLEDEDAPVPDGVNINENADNDKKIDMPDNSSETEELSNSGNASDSEDVPKDENEQIIEDVFGNKDTLDDSQVPKKGFIARFKYRLAQMKAKQIEEEKAEEEAERLEEEEKKKAKEEKKAAAAEKKEQKKQEAEKKKEQKAKKTKESKPKKPKKVKEPPKPGDILKIKPVSIIMFVLFVAGIVVLICILNTMLHYNTNVSQAKAYYTNGDYAKAYSCLNGEKLSGDDEVLYKQASTIMYVQIQYESYENYMKLDMKTEALNSLIKGVNRYQTYKSQAQELGIEDKFTQAYNNVLEALQETFKLNETEAIGLAAQSTKDFTNYYYRIEEYGKAAQ